MNRNPTISPEAYLWVFQAASSQPVEAAAVQGLSAPALFSPRRAAAWAVAVQRAEDSVDAVQQAEARRASPRLAAELPADVRRPAVSVDGAQPVVARLASPWTAAELLAEVVRPAAQHAALSTESAAGVRAEAFPFAFPSWPAGAHPAERWAALLEATESEVLARREESPAFFPWSLAGAPPAGRWAAVPL
jgi:hypothetical protein